MNNTTPLLVPSFFEDLHGVRTFVTTRHGGCSKGVYSSFNCSPYHEDELQDVEKNTDLLRAQLGGYSFPFVIPRQVHGVAIHRVDTEWLSTSAQTRQAALEGVDALITNSPSCMLCVTTADCLPVFLYDPHCRAIGIAHAGWRGAVQHIALRTLQAMQDAYGVSPQNVHVAYGPCISQNAFEVGDEVYDAFSKEGFSMEEIALRKPESGKWHISLQKAVRSELLAAGISDDHIKLCPHCTYTEHEDFFSARRLGIQSGRILSGISLV